MDPEDDQQLWDVLGRAAKPRLSPFFARNILRQVRQEPPLLEGAKSWLRLGILAPAAGVALAVLAAAVFLRSSSPPQNLGENPPAKGPETAAVADVAKKPPEPAVKLDAPLARQAEPVIKIDAPIQQPEAVAKVHVPARQPEPPAAKINSQASEPQALAQIDVQDYEVVANLDDLMVLYETSLWDENSSL